MKNFFLTLALSAIALSSFAQKPDPVYFLDSVTVFDEFDEVVGSSKHQYQNNINTINSYFNLSTYFFEAGLITDFTFHDTIKILTDSQYVVEKFFSFDTSESVSRETLKFTESGKIKSYLYEKKDEKTGTFKETLRMSILYNKTGLIKKIQEKENGIITFTANYFVGDNQKIDSVIHLNEENEITYISHFFNHNENLIPTLRINFNQDSEFSDTTLYEYDSLNRLTLFEYKGASTSSPADDKIEVKYNKDGLEFIQVSSRRSKGGDFKITQIIQRNLVENVNGNYLTPKKPNYYFEGFDPFADTDIFTSSFLIKYPTATSSYESYSIFNGSNTMEKDVEIIFHYDSTTSTTTQAQAQINLELNFFPNPAKDFITIDGSDKSKIARALVYDYNGRLVKLQKVNQNTMDISNLQIGYYVFHFYDQKGNPVHSETIIKN
jgi:hypothetical protein